MPPASRPSFTPRPSPAETGAAVSRGGFYGAGTRAAAAEHLETYLRAVFAFIGIADPEFIVAEGVQIGPAEREKALESALEAATRLSAA